MDPLAPLIAALHSEGRLRVWSLVITIFGDLVQHRGGEISTARLGKLLGRVGVEPGAMRTALSRLGRDGWVTSRRDGRLSLYRLSAQGLDRFAPATSRIYAPPRAAAVTRWAMVAQVSETGEISHSLCPAEAAPEEADCVLTGTLEQLSDAYRRALVPQAHLDALAGLAADLQTLEPLSLKGLDAAAARMLLIHRWRRIVLRHPDVPPEIMPDTAPLRNPRAAVAQIYARLTLEAERWLDGSEGDLAPLPPPDPGPTARFSLDVRA